MNFEGRPILVIFTDFSILFPNICMCGSFCLFPTKIVKMCICIYRCVCVCDRCPSLSRLKSTEPAYPGPTASMLTRTGTMSTTIETAATCATASRARRRPATCARAARRAPRPRGACARRPRTWCAGAPASRAGPRAGALASPPRCRARARGRIFHAYSSKRSLELTVEER